MRPFDIAPLPPPRDRDTRPARTISRSDAGMSPRETAQSHLEWPPAPVGRGEAASQSERDRRSLV